MILDAIDSYYQYVVNQMLTLSATVTINGITIAQPLCGYIQARDWPLTPPVEGGLYLLGLNEIPTDDQSRAQKEYEIHVQWMWHLIGSDITMAQIKLNRSDRARMNWQIEDNLRQANYPGWCRMQSYVANQDGSVTGTPTMTYGPGGPSGSLVTSPIEMVRWTDPRYMPKPDNQKSGLLYGSAALELYARSNISLAVI